MDPNDLHRAMEESADIRRAMESLTVRADAILDLFKSACQNFVAEPTCYDKSFDIREMGLRPKWQQEKYYKDAMASLLICATQSVLAIEAFHITQRIKAAKKAGHKEGVKIAGVTMPDLGPALPDLNGVCQCGHIYGYHTAEEKGFCLDMDCECKSFKPKERETQP